jgi:predicted O-methyltransferase YrrM
MENQVRRLLEELEEFGRTRDAKEPDHENRFLNLERPTAELVSILAQCSRTRHVLEIGTSNGYSTIWLAASVKPHGGRVTSIDRSARKHDLARRNLELAEVLDAVDLRLGDATAVVGSLPGPFDFVLFDGDRVSAPAQLQRLLPKLWPGALVLADNVLSHPAEIAGYLAAIDSLRYCQHVIVPIGKGLSVARIASKTVLDKSQHSNF